MANTIDLNGYAINKELISAGIITPGHLLVRDTSGTVVVHATAGGRAQPLFAREDDLQGNDLTVAYASGDLIQMLMFPPGGEVNALVAASAPAIVVGDFLESAGDGTLRVPVVEADLAGTLTGSVDGTMEDIADIALSTGNTYTDAAVNTAVNAAILTANLENKEMLTKINAILPDGAERPIAVALESVDNSGGGSAVRIRVEIL